jgi:hypothetical protein
MGSKWPKSVHCWLSPRGPRPVHGVWARPDRSPRIACLRWHDPCALISSSQVARPTGRATPRWGWLTKASGRRWGVESMPGCGVPGWQWGSSGRRRMDRLLQHNARVRRWGRSAIRRRGRGSDSPDEGGRRRFWPKSTTRGGASSSPLSLFHTKSGHPKHTSPVFVCCICVS